MKKKILVLILCLCFVMSNCLIVFAYDNNVTEFSLNTCLAETSKYFDLSEYNYIYVYGDYRTDARVYLFPKDVVLVRQNANNYGAYWYAPCLYDENTKTVKYCQFSYEVSIQAGTTSVYNSVTPSSLIAFGYTDAYGNWLNTTNAPCCVDLDYALLYYQTMDAQYLENSGDFIEVPKPKNASLYLASEENALYVYYENEDFSLSSDTITRLWGNYRYRNASGEDIVISAIPQVDVEYVNRNQLKVDLSVLNEYDTGNVFIVLNNVWNDSVDSDWIGFEYRKGSNSYYIFDVVNGEASNLREVVITDYGNVNNSYTGGTVGNITTNIPSAGQGDYSFLGGLFNGFGLLGDNGLIALLTQTFSYVPKEIFIMIGAGISAGIVVALIKWLFD